MDKIIKRSLYILGKYKDLNSKNNVEWHEEDYMAGFVGDVGDLSKLIMIKRGLRGDTKDIDEKIAHELSDCLWSVCVLAEVYSIDLEKAFYRTMTELENRMSDTGIN